MTELGCSSRYILTTLLGNIVEWYDFAIYGYFASLIAKLFFPGTNSFSSLLFALSAFAIGFLARPFGGLVFGSIADCYGRRTALLVSISSIMITTVLIGLLPTYHQIGIYAPLSLIVLRIIQGIAVSGELTISAVYLIESNSVNNRHFLSALIMSSTYLGLLLGALCAFCITLLFNEQQLLQYAWRIPFLLSILLGLLAIFLRLKSDESAQYISFHLEKNSGYSPFKELIKYQKYPLILMILLSNLLGIVIYLLIAFYPSYFTLHSHLSLKQSLQINLFGLVALTISVVLIGKYSERLGLYSLFSYGCWGFIVFTPCLFFLLNNETFYSSLFCDILTALLLSPIAATIMLIMIEVFPVSTRCTAVSTTYNLSMSIFGGTAPLALFSFTKFLDFKIAGSFYLILSSFISFFSLKLLQKNSESKR